MISRPDCLSCGAATTCWPIRYSALRPEIVAGEEHNRYSSILTQQSECFLKMIVQKKASTYQHDIHFAVNYLFGEGHQAVFGLIVGVDQHGQLGTRRFKKS